MGKYRMILIFDRIFHIKAFYSQIWRLPSLKKKNTAFYVEYLLYLTLKNILSSLLSRKSG